MKANPPTEKQAAPPPAPSRGLGDTIDKFTTATGIKKVVKAVVGDDCGCAQRQARLNELFPYRRPLSEDDRLLWETHFLGWRTWPAGRAISATEQRQLMDIYERSTGRRRQFTRCPSCLRTMMEQLDELYLACHEEG